MRNENEEYLGDGLYASFNGCMIILRATCTHGDHWIGLELKTFAGLLDYAKRKGICDVINKNR
jgi:hypothetical protein